MKELGVSQERLGEAFGMGPAAIQKWLAGDRQPSLDQINQIADELKVTRTWLTYGLDSASTIDGLSEKSNTILRHLIMKRDGDVADTEMSIIMKSKDEKGDKPERGERRRRDDEGDNAKSDDDSDSAEAA